MSLTPEQLTEYRLWNNHKLSDPLHQTASALVIKDLLDHIDDLNK